MSADHPFAGDRSGGTGAHPEPEKAAASEPPEVLRALYEAKVAAELGQAETLAPGSDRVAPRGDLLASVALVKGLPGPAEASGGAALTGADGEAADKALAALGWDPARVFRTLSRPEPGIEPARAAARLRRQLEAVGAELVIALDAEAATDVANAFATPALSAGEVRSACGRRLLAVTDFEASLGDAKQKGRVWQQLKSATPLPPVY